jgi:hypothetical protein
MLVLHADILKANKNFADADGLGIVGYFSVDILVDENRIDLE